MTVPVSFQVVVDCADPHSWETYASGLLDASTPSSNMTDVEADPNVVGACTPSALEAYTTRAADLTVDIIPPSEVAFAGGVRGFSCVATVTGSGPTTGSLRG